MNPSPSIDHTETSREELSALREPIRLQKILATAGVGSRRACEKVITEGRVRVNGTIVDSLGSKAVPDTDEITIDGRKISLPQKLIYIFNKPRNVITTMNDPQNRPCVGDYLKDLPFRLYPVGRLDFDVSGLLIMTNDGDYANRLMHPKYGVKRTYIARVENEVTEKKLSLLIKGLHLKDGFAKAHSARVMTPGKNTKVLVGDPKENESLIELTVTEGRKHFVKNILGAIHCPVVKLSRTAFGPYTLKGIVPGQLRQISHREEFLG